MKVLFYSCVSHEGFFIYKSCVWIYFFQNMVIKMLFNNKIQTIFFWTNFTFKNKNKIVYIIEGIYEVVLKFFISTKYQ
jgi:hypothetical protein